MFRSTQPKPSLYHFRTWKAVTQMGKGTVNEKTNHTARILGRCRFGLMVRNNLSFHANRDALQAEWSFPLLKRVSGYLQYFAGYDESLLDCNHKVNRIGIGLILVGWS